MTFHMAYSLSYGQEPRKRVPHSTARYLHVPFDVPPRKYRCTKRITDSSIWFLGLELVQLVRTVRLQKLERNCGRGWRSRSSTFKTIPTVLSWLASLLCISNMYRSFEFL